MQADAAKGAAVALPIPAQERLETEGFEILPLGSTKTRNFEYVYRRAQLEEVIVGGDLVSQGAALASWIVDGFAAVTSVLGGGV